MGFGRLLSAASEIANPVLEAVRSLTTGPTGRRAHTSEDGTHLQVRGLHEPGSENASAELERRLTELDDVHDAEVNAPLSRVAITHDPQAVTADALAEIIDEYEREHGLDSAGNAPNGADHPGPTDVVDEIGALAATVLGVGYTAAASLLPMPRVPAVVPTTLSLVDATPWMRSTLESQLGRRATNLAFATTGVVTQTFALRPISLATDICQRMLTSREAIARHEAWKQWDNGSRRPGTYRATPIEVGKRPTALPGGTIERVANISGSAAAAASATILATTASPTRATAMLVAGVPRATRAGREAFAAHLDTTVSRRGGLVIDSEALRRLDRLDTVVLDSSVLLTGRTIVDSVTVLDESTDEATVLEHANELIDQHDPSTTKRSGEWSIGPAAELESDFGQNVSHDEERAETVLVLNHRTTPIALITVVAEPDPLAESLVSIGASTGRLIVTENAAAANYIAGIDDTVPGGHHLSESVRELQRAGRVVAVVSTRAAAALASSDIGIGIRGSDGEIPWGAHLICPDSTIAYGLLAATEEARTTSRDSSGLSIAGSSLGLVLGLFGPAFGAITRASLPVQAAALCAMGNGMWKGVRAAERPPPALKNRTPWHTMPPGVVLNRLGSREQGLSESEAVRRTPPATTEDTGHGIARTTLEGLINPMTPLLGGGAVISAALGSVLDAVMITSVLGGSTLVDSVQTVRTNQELSRLLEVGQLPALVRRDGVDRTVGADDLVVGDVIRLVAGDGVPADCRLLSCDGLELDESSLTGESDLVLKDTKATSARAIGDRTCLLYQGSVVTTGTAEGVVVATGADTELGRTTRENGSASTEQSGVAIRLSSLTRQMLPLSAAAGVVLMAGDLLRGVGIGQAVSRAVGLAVAAVPEGLPFVATIAELAAARRLSKRGALVRSPATIEALGRVDALCFDKTGTLTRGRISLRAVSDGGTVRTIEQLTPDLREILAAGVRASPRRENGVPLAHPTDQAVLDGAEQAGIVPPCREVPAPTTELPFEPSRGFHATRTDGAAGPRISVKGAPEVVFDRCTSWVRPDGARAFDASARVEIEHEVERLALDGYRVLAVAEREVATGDPIDGGMLDDEEVADLHLIGLLALSDPVHPTAAESVGQLQCGGVDVIMITGDHPSTAESVAAELGMLSGGRMIMQGTELDEIDDDELAADLPKIAVFARVSPAQKARIVRMLRADGRVVAMTGDGANDVPAIKLAQVGIALGTRATPAARESADLVITDDRIETISDAIIEGRGMWASVHDALSILLGGNLGEIAYALVSGLMGGSGALNARQLLVVNLLTDVLPAAAIAVRPPPGADAEKLLAEGPEASLGASLNRDVYARATATASAAGITWLLTRPLATAGQARTAGLVALVSTQLVQTVAMRARTPLVLGASAVSLLALAAVVQVPGVSQFFGSQPLLPHHWAVALGIACAASVAVTAWQLRVRSRESTNIVEPAE